MTAARLLGGLLSLALATPLSAQKPEPRPGPELTLLEAARLALESHPSVGAAEARRAAAAASHDEAAAAWFPDVTLEADYTRFEEPMLVTPLHAFDLTQRPVFDRDVVVATLASRWTVFDGGERSGRIGQADALEDAAKADLDDARARLLSAVTSAYLDVLSLAETLDAHERRLDALEEERDRVQLAVREEKLARVEASRVEAALAAGRADRVSAAESLDVAVRDLARLIGQKDIDRAAIDTLVGRLVSPVPRPPETGPGPYRKMPSDAETREARVDSLPTHAETPALRRAESELAASEAARRAAVGSWFPDLQLASGYVERGALDESYTGEWQVGVQLEYALFAGGARQAAVSRAEAERRAAMERLRLVEDETAARIDRALAAVESTRVRAAALAAAVDARGEVARIERVAVEIGAGIESDYLDAVADLLEAQAAEIRARHSILEAEVELARATGTLDFDWLEQRLREAP
ncbi:MAG: TolC family protein [Gemmatimonadota bacterium]